jgi:hypothetical protein
MSGVAFIAINGLFTVVKATIYADAAQFTMQSQRSSRSAAAESRVEVIY